jgi:hypothetical protein
MGFETLKKDDFTIYPNPTQTNFTINTEGLAKLAIYDLKGSLLISTMVEGKEAVSVSKLPAGIYFVKIITAYSIVTKQLVIK